MNQVEYLKRWRARMMKDPTWRKKESERSTKAKRKWRKENPQRYSAHGQVFIALRNGTLQKKPCHCGELKVDAHHPDYSKPLEVVWLCRLHHKHEHLGYPQP